MKVQIDVPDSLKEITLKQYQRYEKLNTEDNKDTTFLQQKMVEVFCDLNLKDVASIKYKSVQEITKHLNKIFNVKTELTTTFKLGDKEFGFIPMLDDITLGEYIDLDTYLAEWANMHKAMNVLYRPIKFKKGNKYNIEDYKETDNTELFKHIPLNVVMGSLVFFWNLKNELLKTILNYLTKETEEMTMEQRLALQGSGDGILQSLTLLKKMLPSLTILQG